MIKQDGSIAGADAARRLNKGLLLKHQVLPRTRRAKAGIEKIATAMMTFDIPLPITATTAIASKIPGKANSTSQIRIMMRSHQPS